MIADKPYEQMSTPEIFRTLRREILAARLKIALDKELKRTSTPTQKRLANMTLPPIHPEKPYEKMSTEELFEVLHREILAARLKVTLDKELNRTSMPMQKRLASMSLPPQNPVKPHS